MVCNYIDNVLVITKNNPEENLKALDRFLQRLTEAGLKVNAEILLRTNTNGISWFLSKK